MFLPGPTKDPGLPLALGWGQTNPAVPLGYREKGHCKVHRKGGAGLLAEAEQALPNRGSSHAGCSPASRALAVPEGFIQLHKSYHLSAGPRALSGVLSNLCPRRLGTWHPSPAGFFCSSPCTLTPSPLYPDSQSLFKLLQNQEAWPLPPFYLNSVSLEDPAREPSFPAPTCCFLWPWMALHRELLFPLKNQSCSPPHLFLWLPSCLLSSTEQDQGAFFLSKYQR